MATRRYEPESSPLIATSLKQSKCPSTADWKDYSTAIGWTTTQQLKWTGATSINMDNFYNIIWKAREKLPNIYALYIIYVEFKPPKTKIIL